MSNLQLTKAVSLLAFNVQCHFGGNCPKIHGKTSECRVGQNFKPPKKSAFRRRKMSDNGKSGTGLFTFCLTKWAQGELNNA